ncbi:MAG TPA: cysteine--tRNA ligase [Bacteroidetes bacterium]|nr:cysteine--tRNA ligase [Bacteroidota bacterium]
MADSLRIYNTLTRKKEVFEPLHPGHVGLYVCGPTVYGDAHLGHARPAISFDVLYRYLTHLGYKVRYVRNITDVGHLEQDADEGEDKVARKARLEKMEPMEVVQYYMNRYHENMRQLNVLPPSIEPMASGHIIEQQQMVNRILQNGYAYEKNGSVYFDLKKYSETFPYGKLSGRVMDDLMTYTRELEGQEEKKHPFDFALWKKAGPAHLMKWPSPWGEGFPGWHLECSVMSTRYLGETFDIHGGGMDLVFPHHECEIAQSTAALGKSSVRYWMHNNMVTLNGQKMGKSLGNAVSLEEFFSGNHSLIEKAYSPMTIRFFILQAHYRSTVDFSNPALQAAEKGLERLFNGMRTLEKLKPAAQTTGWSNSEFRDACYAAMNDDLQTPLVISQLFEAVRYAHSVQAGTESITAFDLEELMRLFKTFAIEILGLHPEESGFSSRLPAALMDLIIRLRSEARKRKDFTTADEIRNELEKLGIILKDSKEGTEWEMKE